MCVSDRWTLEYDLALFGCAELMHLAITLAAKAKSRDERLDEQDEVDTLAAAKLSWAKLKAAGHAPEMLAAIIYRPLQEKEASKAISAQYAAHLVSTGEFGEDDALFKKLPPYLRTALAHLTSAPITKSNGVHVAAAGVSVPNASVSSASVANPSSVPSASNTVSPISPMPSGLILSNAIPAIPNVPHAAEPLVSQVEPVQISPRQGPDTAAATGIQGGDE